MACWTLWLESLLRMSRRLKSPADWAATGVAVGTRLAQRAANASVSARAARRRWGNDARARPPMVTIVVGLLRVNGMDGYAPRSSRCASWSGGGMPGDGASITRMSYGVK